MSEHKPKWAVQSSADDLDSMHVNLYGPPTAGKTWGALSISKDWPEDIADRDRDSAPVVLSDIIHIGWDPGALVGLLPHNVSVKYTYNMADMIAACGNMVQATHELIADVRGIIDADEGVIAVIHDTVTSADRESLHHWNRPENMPASRSGVPDTQKMYGLHLAWHRLYHTEFSHMPSGISNIFLFHEKILDDVGDLMQRNVSKKQLQEAKNKLLGDKGVNVVPAMTGSGLNFYTASPSMELVIINETKPGKKGEYIRWLYPTSTQGRRSKNRFEHLLRDKEEPNLRKLLNKIKGS